MCVKPSNKRKIGEGRRWKKPATGGAQIKGGTTDEGKKKTTVIRKRSAVKKSQ